MPLKTYNDEFKVAAAKLVARAGLHASSRPPRASGVDPGSIRGWVRKFAPAPAAPAADASPPRSCDARTSGSARRTAGSSWSARF